MLRFTFYLRDGRKMFSRPEVVDIQYFSSMAEHLVDSLDFDMVELIVPGLNDGYYHDVETARWLPKNPAVLNTDTLQSLQKDLVAAKDSIRVLAAHWCKVFTDQLEISESISVAFNEDTDEPYFVCIEKGHYQKEGVWFPLYVVGNSKVIEDETNHELYTKFYNCEFHHTDMEHVAIEAFLTRILVPGKSEELYRPNCGENQDWGRLVKNNQHV